MQCVLLYVLKWIIKCLFNSRSIRCVYIQYFDLVSSQVVVSSAVAKTSVAHLNDLFALLASRSHLGLSTWRRPKRKSHALRDHAHYAWGSDRFDSVSKWLCTWYVFGAHFWVTNRWAKQITVWVFSVFISRVDICLQILGWPKHIFFFNNVSKEYLRIDQITSRPYNITDEFEIKLESCGDKILFGKFKCGFLINLWNQTESAKPNHTYNCQRNFPNIVSEKQNETITCTNK